MDIERRDNHYHQFDQHSEVGSLAKYIKDPAMIQVLQGKGIKSLFPIQY